MKWKHVPTLLSKHYRAMSRNPGVAPTDGIRVKERRRENNFPLDPSTLYKRKNRFNMGSSMD